MSAIASLTIITPDGPSNDVLRTTGAPVPVGSPTGSASSSRSTSNSVAESVGLNLSAIGKSEARKIMSEEHRILGFRPPQGSLAAEAQAAAAKHPEGAAEVEKLDIQKLKVLAREDAERILARRKSNPEMGNMRPKVSRNGKTSPRSISPRLDVEGVNLNTISASEARVLMSHEHKALGFRPPPGSLAAEAQAAAAKHPEGAGTEAVHEEVLKVVALKDADKIKADRGEADATREAVSVKDEELEKAIAAVHVDAEPSGGSQLTEEPVAWAMREPESRTEVDSKHYLHPLAGVRRPTDVMRSSTESSVEIVGDVFSPRRAAFA